MFLAELLAKQAAHHPEQGAWSSTSRSPSPSSMTIHITAMRWSAEAVGPACVCAAATIALTRFLPDPRDAAGQQAADEAADREDDGDRAVRRPHQPDRAAGLNLNTPR